MESRCNFHSYGTIRVITIARLVRYGIYFLIGCQLPGLFFQAVVFALLVAIAVSMVAIASVYIIDYSSGQAADESVTQTLPAHYHPTPSLSSKLLLNSSTTARTFTKSHITDLNNTHVSSKEDLKADYEAEPSSDKDILHDPELLDLTNPLRKVEETEVFNLKTRYGHLLNCFCLLKNQ